MTNSFRARAAAANSMPQNFTSESPEPNTEHLLENPHIKRRHLQFQLSQEEQMQLEQEVEILANPTK